MGNKISEKKADSVVELFQLSMTTHSLLKVLRSSRPAFGAWLTVPGLLHARTLAKSSPHLSWIVVDCEHGTVPLVPGAAESVSAIESAGVTPIIRIPATGVSGSTSWQIKYALDAGARGVIVPMVRSILFLLFDVVASIYANHIIGFQCRKG